MAAEKDEMKKSGDTEAAHHEAQELKRQKKRKLIIFIVFFVVSNVVINSIMAVTIMKARNPKFRIREATITNFNGGTPARLNIQFTLKNTNFGRYKYPNATVVFMHQGVQVGTAEVRNNKVGWRSTKKFSLLDVELNLGNDANTAIYPITAHAKLRGKAAIMFMMNKRKGADLNCIINIVRATQQINTLACR